MASRFRVLAIDQRGHGGASLSTRTEGRTSWDDFRGDLVAFLEQLDVRDAVLSGHSMGGATCLAAAARAPGRARRLVLFDPVIPPRRSHAQPRSGGHARLIEGAHRRRAEFADRAAAFAAYRQRSAFAGWDPAMLADYVQEGFRDLPGGGVRLTCEPAWEASTFAAQPVDAWSAFDEIAIPVEILKAGRESTCHTDEEDERLACSGQVVIETAAEASHFLPMEFPDLARARLARALAGD